MIERDGSAVMERCAATWIAIKVLGGKRVATSWPGRHTSCAKR